MSKAQQYEKAKELRKRGLLGNITENLIEGRGSIAGGIGRGVSQTLGAKVTGIKEAFDPLNLARKMAGGLGVGLIGRATGRSKEDMSHFLGKTPAKTQAPSASKVGNVSTALYANVSDGSRSKLNKNERLANVGAKLYIALKTSYEINKLEKELARNFSKEIEREDQRRHEELIKSIGKPQKPEQKKVETRKVEKAIGKPTTPAPSEAPAPAPASTPSKAPAPAAAPTPSKAPAPVPAPTPSKAPAPAPTPSKAPTPAPAPTATPQKKVAAIEKPKAEPVKVEPTKAPEKKVAAIEKPKPPEAKMETPKAESAKVPEKKVAAIEKPKTAEVKTEPAKVPEKKVASIEKPKQVPTAKPEPAPPAIKPSATKEVAKVGAAGVAAVGTFTSSESFAKTMLPYAQKASVDMGGKIPPEALVSQWALESSWGSKPSGDYNYFGVKADKNWKGDKKLITTTEVLNDAGIQRYKDAGLFIKELGKSGDKTKVLVNDYFRSYSSIDDAVKDKVDFFKKNPRYQKAGLFEASTSEEYFKSLQSAGYATDPNYVTSNLSMVSSVNKRLQGTALSQASIQNADAKKQSKGQTTVIQDNSTKIVSAGAKQPGVLKETPRDLPLHQQ